MLHQTHDTGILYYAVWCTSSKAAEWCLKVPAEKLRWAVGCILTEGNQEFDDELLKLFEGHGFMLFNIPAVQQVVTTTFPYNTVLSIYIAIYRVYSAIGRYMEVLVCNIVVLLEMLFTYATYHWLSTEQDR